MSASRARLAARGDDLYSFFNDGVNDVPRGVPASECARAQRTRGRAQHTRAGALTLALSLRGKEA